MLGWEWIRVVVKGRTRGKSWVKNRVWGKGRGGEGLGGGKGWGKGGGVEWGGVGLGFGLIIKH